MDDSVGVDRMWAFIGPGHVDQQIRQAIQCAWMSLPAGKQSVEEVERVVRHLVDRALKDFREDAETFRQGV
jgi:hypothetical protein